jgi:radical SAM superfamily enzyme YgiQ (UPF0313 family)
LGGVVRKITFVALGQEQLAVSLLSSVLKREGHATSLVYDPLLFQDRMYLEMPRLGQFFDRFDSVVDEIVEHDPDLLAFTVITPVYQRCLAIAAAVKERIDVPVIFGGVHPSAVPEICLENPCIDYVCIGEGEEALVRLCDELPESGDRPREPIANLAWLDASGRYVRGPSSPFLQDLDSLPYWDKDLWTDHIRISDNWLTMSSRGCPYRCTFCFNNFFAKIPGKGNSRGYLRQRSIDHMMGELVEAKARFDIKRVEFDDDIFTTKKQWIRDFLVEYRREIDVPFVCLVHPRYIDTEMARWLRDAGCESVQMGVQSVDEEYKRGELLRMENDSHLKSSLASLREAKLPTRLDHMLGLPNEPKTAQDQAREIYAEYPPQSINTYWLTHLPGIAITRQAVERGQLSEDDFAAINRGEGGQFHTRAFIPLADQGFYRRYEMLYQLLPLLPRPLRTRIRAHHLPVLPEAVTNVIGLVLEAANAVVHRDSDAPIYVRYYAHQMRRQLPALARDVLRRRRPLRGPAPLQNMPRHPPIVVETACEATPPAVTAGPGAGAVEAAGALSVPVAVGLRRGTAS